MRFICGLILVLATSVAHAGDVHGILRVVKGNVQIKSGSTGQTAKAKLGAKVFPKDTIITGKDARAKVVMVDNNEINVSPDSQIELQNYEYDPAAGKKDVLLNVIYGKVRSKVEQKYDGRSSKFQIKTPSAVAGVRGTDFMTSYNRADNTSNVVTFEGRVEFGLPGPGGTIKDPVSVMPGTQASTNGSAAPSAPAPVDKKELASMDKESNAETGNKEIKQEERQPADDGGKKDNKNDAKDGTADGNAGKGDDKKEAGDKGDGRQGSNSGVIGDGSGDTKGPGGPPGAPPGGPGSSSDRGPANSPGGMMLPGDLAGSGGNMVIGNSGGAYIPVNTGVNTGVQPTNNDGVKDHVSGGSGKLIITINQGP